MNQTPTLPRRLAPSAMIARAMCVCAAAAVATWLWSCFCIFPAHDWNSVRLAPSFMLRAGISPYPAPLHGPLTTWIYGPVSLLLYLPATLTSNPVPAIMISAAVNLLIGLVPLWLCARAFAGTSASPAVVIWTFILTIAAWPATNWIFLQPDNAAVAFGLLSILCLNGASPDDTRKWWAGAGLAALALWSKQTELAPLLAQIVFCLVRFGPRRAAVQALRCGAAAAILGAIFLPLFGAEGLIYNMFIIPAALPHVALWAKMIHPIYRGYVIVLVVVPVVLVLWKARTIFSRQSPLLLAGLAFSFSLPVNLAGFATIGGNINSLHAALYLLPAAAVWCARRIVTGHWRAQLAAVLVVAGALAAQAHTQRFLRWRPQLTGLRQGCAIARQLPDAVYFPWNPLLTYFTDGRFYHAADGIAARFLVNQPISPALMNEYLPRRFSVVAYHEVMTDDLVKVTFIPRTARKQLFGEWILYSWPPPKPRAGADASAHRTIGDK